MSRRDAAPAVDLPAARVGAAFHPRRDELTVADAYADQGAVERLVRHALLAAGLGRRHPDAPLADLIQPGDTVLLKPNWVLDRNQAGHGMECLVTHPSVIVAVLREVARADPGRVVVGDAPIQLCDFDRIVTREVGRRFQQAVRCPLDIADFRRTVAASQDMSDGVCTGLGGEERFVRFDLARTSLLEPVSSEEDDFRITNYDPRELSRTHRRGRHQYLVCRDALEADVVIGLPKLKTHRKAGITGALKNLVGINGSKEFLPHHRRGSVEEGGDCYARRSLTLSAVEEALDRANRSIGTAGYKVWYDRAMKYWRRENRRAPAQVEGSWHGNDTVWRMALDLNRVLLYGRADGTMADRAVRHVYSITDAIVAGQGEGPLAPAPAVLGAVTCANGSAYGDLMHATLMGFDWRRIPIVRESFGSFAYPIALTAPADCVLAVHDGGGVTATPFAEVFEGCGRRFEPPSTWRGHIERDADDREAA